MNWVEDKLDKAARYPRKLTHKEWQAIVRPCAKALSFHPRTGNPRLKGK
jgi:hypothetical protein